MDAEATEARLSERTQHLIRIYKPLHDIRIYLDLGCGTGTITREVAIHYGVVQAIGVDLPTPSDADSEGPVVILKANSEARSPPPETRQQLPPSATALGTKTGNQTSTPPPPSLSAGRQAPPSGLGSDIQQQAGRSPIQQQQQPRKPRNHDTTYEYRQLLENGVIPIEDNSVDFVTCIMAIHHFEKFDQMMSEVKRVLSPNGVLFIREHDVPRHDKLLAKSLDNMHENFSDHTTSGVINYWPRDELKKKLTEGFGFKHVFDDDYPPGTPNPQKIYHSLYAKQLGELKYIPPWERKVQQQAQAPPPAVQTQSAGAAATAASKLAGFRGGGGQGAPSGSSAGDTGSTGAQTSGGLMGRFDSPPTPPAQEEDRFAGLGNRGGGGNATTASSGKQTYKAKGGKGGGSSAGGWRK